ncbi:hypothetical protein IAT40_004499 [Kwoniella sp. CBS 6097]
MSQPNEHMSDPGGSESTAVPPRVYQTTGPDSTAPATKYTNKGRDEATVRQAREAERSLPGSLLSTVYKNVGSGDPDTNAAPSESSENPQSASGRHPLAYVPTHPVSQQPAVSSTTGTTQLSEPLMNHSNGGGAGDTDSTSHRNPSTTDSAPA